MTKIEEYFSEVDGLLKKAVRTQRESIQQAAEAVAATLSQGGTVFAFGTGHSHMLAEELFYRAGGLAKVYPLLDEPLMLHTNASRSSHMERLAGYARTLLEYGPQLCAGDVLFIFSNSGRNTVSIDMAIQAKEKGLHVICITNLAHSSTVTSRHPSGKKLYEVCDTVIDNGGAVGDAAIPVGDLVCGPTSTVVGAAILEAIVCGAVERMQLDGFEPEVFRSGNIDGGDEINEEYIQKYRSVIRIL